MKKRLLTAVLALVMAASLFAVSAAGADKRPWEDAYRQAIKDNTDKYAGWTMELVDLDLNGTPELLLARLPGTGLFQMVESMFTFENNTLKKVTLQDVNNTMMGNAGTFEGEEIPYYVAYRNDATGACKIELHWLIRNGYREHGAFLGTCTLANGVYTQQTHYCHHVMDDVSTYYVGDQKVSYNQYLSSLRARNNGWTKITPFAHASVNASAGKKPTDTQINQLFAAYPANGAHTVGGFRDVMSTDYYSDPVVWAATHDPQITNGTSPTTFSPNAECTRGQVVTFLWRASGCPEPKSDVNPFSDVDPQEYYGKAVLWAVENGITNGMGVGVFAPNGTVTRGQVVTFLWRMHDSPVVSGSAPFSDVPAGEYYSDAVLWAVQNGVTNGKTDTTFAPNDSCTRGQIVTFLYRDMA